MKFTFWVLSIAAFAALGADLSLAGAVKGLHFAQDEKQALQSPGELARMLDGQAKVVSVPAKGKAKRRLDKNEKHLRCPMARALSCFLSCRTTPRHTSCVSKVCADDPTISRRRFSCRAEFC